MVPFNPYATSGPEIWIMISAILFIKTGIVRAKRIPKSNEFGFGDDMVIDGSIYAIGKLTPDAFSILLIPEITIGKRLRINEYSFFGKIPLLYASFTFNNGSMKKKL